MSRIFVIMVAFVLSSCSIPSEFIRSDGTLVVEMTGPDSFRVGNRAYTTGALEVAMQLLSGSSTFKSVDIYIPIEIAHRPNLPCQSIVLAMEKSRRPWKFYEWTPGHPETIVPSECERAVLS